MASLAEDVFNDAIDQESDGTAALAPLPPNEEEPTGETEFVAYDVVHALPGRVRLRIPRLKHDAAFAERYNRFVAAQPGVRAVRVNRACASVVVAYDLARLDPADAAAALTTLTRRQRDDAASRSPAAPPSWQRALLAPSVAVALGLLGAPPLAVAAGLAVATVPVARRALESLFGERRLNVDALDTTAVAMMAVQGNMVAAGGLLWLVALGEGIRERTARAARGDMASLLASLRRDAWVLRHGRPVRVAADRVAPGETVLVHPGELVLVDGVVRDGVALVDQSTLTGEAAPVRRAADDQVFAGTLVREGSLAVTAERVGDRTRASQIIRLQEQAPIQDTRAANYAARFADRLVPPTFALAAAAGVLTGNLSHAASILITDFATGIRVATPTAVLATLRQAARSGILLRSGRALEQLAEADTVVFDKTGTLTIGRPEVRHVRSFDQRWSPDHLLALAASAERGMQHPAAAAIRAAATQRGLALTEARSWRYHLGLGVAAQLGDYAVLVGSRRFLSEAGVATADPPDEAASASVVYVAIDGTLAGVIVSEDPIRPEAPAVLRALRERGVRRVLLVTGDRQEAGAYVGRQLGVDAVIAESFPEQKARVVQELAAAGYRVAFVGDGINDSPALAYADVSVSLRHGADVARETADVLLMDGGLAALPEARRLAQDGMRVVRQSVAIVAAPNAVALALAAAGRLSPVAATIINNGSTIVAGLNALRPLAQRPRATLAAGAA